MAQPAIATVTSNPRTVRLYFHDEGGYRYWHRNNGEAYVLNPNGDPTNVLKWHGATLHKAACATIAPSPAVNPPWKMTNTPKFVSGEIGPLEILATLFHVPLYWCQTCNPDA